MAFAAARRGGADDRIAAAGVRRLGTGLISLYNDGYLPILGNKHPEALAQSFPTLWSELWDQFRPLVESTMRGQAQYFEDMPVALSGREGRPMRGAMLPLTSIKKTTSATPLVFARV